MQTRIEQQNNITDDDIQLFRSRNNKQPRLLQENNEPKEETTFKNGAKKGVEEFKVPWESINAEMLIEVNEFCTRHIKDVEKGLADGKDLVQSGECKDSFDVHPAENVLPKAFNLELHVSKSSKVRHLTV
ncbi:hypothetical protein M0802_003305 [Mischocyttarus mexicanus]|nr:hypothetical protein M0802_003305 [Mischocyttarus mexicanus]